MGEAGAGLLDDSDENEDEGAGERGVASGGDVTTHVKSRTTQEEGVARGKGGGDSKGESDDSEDAEVALEEESSVSGMRGDVEGCGAGVGGKGGRDEVQSLQL